MDLGWRDWGEDKHTARTEVIDAKQALRNRCHRMLEWTNNVLRRKCRWCFASKLTMPREAAMKHKDHIQTASPEPSKPCISWKVRNFGLFPPTAKSHYILLICRLRLIKGINSLGANFAEVTGSRVRISILTSGSGFEDGGPSVWSVQVIWNTSSASMYLLICWRHLITQHDLKNILE